MNNYKPKVSVIVPCYNVAQFIGKCIQSIIDQNYPYLEIIPVNDGSPDNTPQILDNYAQRDNRIRVIHKQNEGVSAARNSGLKIATGDYVVFVDGDDYLANDYIDYMLRLALKDDADFVLSKKWFMRDNQKQITDDQIKTITPEEATALLLSPDIMVGCWNKMYRKKFLDDNNLWFSTNLFYGEGLYFITKASQLANKVTTGERMVYYYRRNNEDSATTKYKYKNYCNGELAINKIAEDLLVKDTNVTNMLAIHKSLFCINALSHTYAQGVHKKYQKDCNHWKSEIHRNLPILLRSSEISLYRKCLVLGGVLFPGIYAKLNTWHRHRNVKLSVK